MKKPAALTIYVLFLAAWSVGALAGDADIDHEDALKRYKDSLTEEPAWKEQGLVIPPYPVEANLIDIGMERFDYPYRVFVDGASLSVGKEDGVVRFTAVLRSRSGVDNVSFEGIRCVRHQYKRYAYGSGGRFHEVPDAEWQRIRKKRQDIYRNVLANQYLCPVPTGDPVPQLVKKLKAGADRYLYQGDME